MIQKRRRIPVQGFISEKKPTIKESTAFFSVRARKNKTSENRFGVVISAKVHKSATVRNKLKRRVLGGVNSWEDKGLDIVIYILSSAPRLSKREFYKELEKIKNKLFRKIT